MTIFNRKVKVTNTSSYWISKSIIGGNSNQTSIEYSAAKCPVLYTRLILIYISKSTLVLILANLAKNSRHTNLDLKNLAELLNANKSSLILSKTESLIFKRKKNVLGKKSRLMSLERGIRWDIQINENLQWKR